MKIYLARHGQSRWQVERNDDWNSPLTETGRAQARLLARWLAEEPALDSHSRLSLTAVQASPLLRTQQTAEPVAAMLKRPLQTNDFLREADFWIPEHLPSGQSPYQAMPEFVPSTIYAAFKAQAQQALHSLAAAAEAADGPILAFSHGGLISTMLRLVTGGDFISFWIYNTSLNLIEWKRGRWHFVHLNLWDHLPPDLRTF